MRYLCHEGQLARLNAPTGAWCSLTARAGAGTGRVVRSQCTYRCVVLPDVYVWFVLGHSPERLNAPTGAWCSLTLEVDVTVDEYNSVSMHLQVRGAP